MLLREVSDQLTDLIRPPRRMRVSEAAAEGLYLTPASRWDPDTAPYMIRPMDETASRHHDVVCFVGPARTGKTLALILGRWVYTAICHPMDFAVIHSSEGQARDLSIRELDRLHRHSPGMRHALTGRASDSNTFDKRYRSGVIGILGWPSSKQLASRTIPVMLLTDYGRWQADIGGEGDGFTQARKRTQTGGSLAMTVVESSPGEDVSPDDDSEPQVHVLGKPLSHRFPLTIAGAENSRVCPIYDGGTREWWYVPCQACGEYYPQDWHTERLSWGDDPDPIKAAETAGTVCCWCGAVHPEATKRFENANGNWLAEGQVIDWQGRKSGESRIGKTYPSFSIGGGAAAYQTRKSIVIKYLTALADARATGDENSLRGVMRGDFGAPYRPIKATSARAAFPIMRRAKPVKKLIVPTDVRFLLAAVDVQANRFVAQVVGYGPDRNRWVIDYYNLKQSERISNSGEACSVDPATYDEDWDLLLPLITKVYPTVAGKFMEVAGVLCDSGGAEGVTDKAYRFWRQLPADLQQRFRLVKGESKDGAPLVEQRWPDTRNRKARGASRGNVPVLFISTNRIKDRLDNDLAREDHGPGYCNFPDWLGEWWFRGLTREKRDASGKWSGASKNEPWDLMVYGEAGAIVGVPFGARMNGIDRPGFWERPPPWALPQDTNSMVKDSAEGHKTAKPKPTPYKPRTLTIR